MVAEAGRSKHAFQSLQGTPWASSWPKRPYMLPYAAGAFLMGCGCSVRPGPSPPPEPGASTTRPAIALLGVAVAVVVDAAAPAAVGGGT